MKSNTPGMGKIENLNHSVLSSIEQSRYFIFLFAQISYHSGLNFFIQVENG
jgi:hypothetical protein